FRRLLERQNVVIDAYQDLREPAVKGKILRTTDYLILGDGPDLDFGVVRDDDPKAKHRNDIRAQMDEAQEHAIKNGVTIIPIRRFMMKAGIKPPRSSNAGVGTRNPFDPARGDAPDKDPKNPPKDPKDPPKDPPKEKQ